MLEATYNVDPMLPETPHGLPTSRPGWQMHFGQLVRELRVDARRVQRYRGSPTWRTLIPSYAEEYMAANRRPIPDEQAQWRRRQEMLAASARLSANMHRLEQLVSRPGGIEAIEALVQRELDDAAEQKMAAVSFGVASIPEQPRPNPPPHKLGVTVRDAGDDAGP